METKIINLFGPSGTGKCFAKGTRVRMYDGSIKNIEDIKIGDFVMGDDSTARMVLELHQGKAPLYMIERSFSSPIIVSANHILTLKHRVGGIKTYWEEIDIPLEDYMLLIKFSNGEEKVFDVKPYLEDKVFFELKNKELFKTVKVGGLSIEWANGLDICPDELYNQSKKI